MFPNFKSQDVVEISGEAGSCKTELLYHLISRCVLPRSWKGVLFNGLEVEVTFIDNDCHFDLFRFVSIMENRVKALARASNADVSKKDIVSFIQDRLKLLHIIKCYDSDEFILSLSSLESGMCLQQKTKFIMIDGLSSFYWSDRARVQNNLSKLAAHYKIITNLILKISKKLSTPIIITRRKLLSIADSDKKVFGNFWNSEVSWKLELKYQSSLPDKTVLTVLNTQTSATKLCYVSKLGFNVLEENKSII